MVKYRYDDPPERISRAESGNRIEKIKGGVTERYIRDHAGREMALHSSTEGYKYFNLFGNGAIGRVDVGSCDAVWTDPETNEEIMVKLRVDNRRYYVQDHLGSNRVTIDTTGAVLNAQDYYAFGEILRSYNNSSPNERYYFTGKERDTETNLDYFGARYYDSEIGRWLNVDPLADKYPGLSPYNYCLNNPVNSVDPDGMAVEKPIDTILDIAFIAFDVGKLAYDKVTTGKTNREDWAALGADVVCALTPVATGGGMAVRGANKVDDVVDAVRAVEKTGNKTYEPYKKTNPETNKTYAGRTSGKGSPF